MLTTACAVFAYHHCYIASVTDRVIGVLICPEGTTTGIDRSIHWGKREKEGTDESMANGAWFHMSITPSLLCCITADHTTATG